MKTLGLEIPEYETELDPTRNSDTSAQEMDWTIGTSQIKDMKILYKKVCTPVKRKRKTFMYEREVPKPIKKERKSFLGKEAKVINELTVEIKETNDSNANQSQNIKKDEAIKEEPTSSSCNNDIEKIYHDNEVNELFEADESNDMIDDLESNII